LGLGLELRYGLVVKPMRVLQAAKLALERGWAINIGGGFHHCCSVKGGGFCAYADITLAIRCLKRYCNIRKAMIIDLDAHQVSGLLVAHYLLYVTVVQLYTLMLCVG
jgi:acetoin utilization deacetylase AcuC-like enzyme